MERIGKGSDLPKEKGGHRASNKNIRRSSYCKGHQGHQVMRGAFLHFLTVTPTGFDLLPSNLESKLSNEYLLNPFLQTIDEAIKGTKA